MCHFQKRDEKDGVDKENYTNIYARLSSYEQAQPKVRSEQMGPEKHKHISEAQPTEVFSDSCRLEL